MISKKFLIAIFSIIFIYYFSWYLFGESLLLEKGFKYFVEEYKPKNIEYHPRKEFVIIPKKHGIIYPKDFSTEVPGKNIIVIKDSISAIDAINNQPDDFSWENFKIYGLEINISSYHFPTGKLQFYILGNDTKGDVGYYLWGIFGWIKIID